MKTLYLIILASIPAFADLPKPGGLAENWLEPPDGFAWPSTPEDSPKFETKWEAVEGLEKGLRAGIQKIWPGRIIPGKEELDPSLPESVELARVDLNGDGKMEVFVGISVYSGSGGRYYEILAEGEQGYRSIGTVQGTIHLRDRKDRWIQLEMWSRGGGWVYSRSLLQHTAGGYETIRQEIHNFNEGSVAVKAPKNARETEQGGARQPATRLESEPEENENP